MRATVVCDLSCVCLSCETGLLISSLHTEGETTHRARVVLSMGLPYMPGGIALHHWLVNPGHLPRVRPHQAASHTCLTRVDRLCSS